jgi:hypothetical protein
MLRVASNLHFTARVELAVEGEQVAVLQGVQLEQVKTAVG